MDTIKQWVALTVVGCVAVLAAAWFLLVSPTRSEAADLREQAASQVQSNASLRAQLEVLQAQAEQLPEQEAALAAVAAKVPADAALPALVRALDGLAGGTGVELVTVAPGTVTSGTPDPAAAPADPAAAPVPAPAAGFSRLPLTLEVVGGFYDVQAFVAGLEELTRAVRVTALHLVPGANPVDPDAAPDVDSGRSLRVSITAEAYVAPATADGGLVVPPPAPAVAAAAPAGGSS